MLKRSKLEVSVLVLGGLVIAGSLFLKFFSGFDPKAELIITNIVFAVGFLIYIVYSIVSTNNLNKEIRSLSSEVASLEDKVETQDRELRDKAERIKSLESEKTQLQEAKASLEKDLGASREECDSLQEEIAEIRSSKKEAKP